MQMKKLKNECLQGLEAIFSDFVICVWLQVFLNEVFTLSGPTLTKYIVLIRYPICDNKNSHIKKEGIFWPNF